MMDWFTGRAGPTGTKLDRAPSQTGAAGGCWWAMRQASCSGQGQWKHYTGRIWASDPGQTTDCFSRGVAKLRVQESTHNFSRLTSRV